MTPRKPTRQPVVWNQTEVRMLLEAARSLRDKLLMSLMYGVGLWVSEVSRLRWSELDFERKSARVCLGKGRKDRVVVLPETLIPLLRQICDSMPNSEFVFPAEGCRNGRHISPRTVQRAVESSADLAGIRKNVTPHSFRHSFATYLVEDGMDIRFIQKLPDHARLETTTIYTQVAVLEEKEMCSPLDQLNNRLPTERQAGQSSALPCVGKMRLPLDFADRPAGGTNSPQKVLPAIATATVAIRNSDCDVQLKGIVLRESRPGWIAMEIPPEEQWENEVSQLPKVQQDRVRSPDFLDLLKTEFNKRFLFGRSGHAMARGEHESVSAQLCVAFPAAHVANRNADVSSIMALSS